MYVEDNVNYRLTPDFEQANQNQRDFCERIYFVSFIETVLIFINIIY